MQILKITHCLIIQIEIIYATGVKRMRVILTKEASSTLLQAEKTLQH